MEIKIVYPEDTKPYSKYYPIYGGKEEIIEKTAKYLKFEQIKKLVDFLDTFDIEQFQQQKFTLHVGDFGYESWFKSSVQNNI